MIDDIVIVDSEDETLAPVGRKLTSDTLAKIDEILYADIGKLQKMDKVDKVRICLKYTNHLLGRSNEFNGDRHFR